MLEFKEYFLAKNIESAYTELMKNKRNRVIGGGSYLRLGNNSFNTIIDLSLLNLDKITESENFITVGAMVNFRELELNPIIKNNFSGIISDSISGILGVQFRSNVTVGATVASKYGFSDLITALLPLNTKLVFHKMGEISLEKHLEDFRVERDILLEIKIPKIQGMGKFLTLRKTSTDYSVVNIAIVKSSGKYRVALGARPKRSVLVESDNLEEILNIVEKNVEFQTNTRASGEYRKLLAKNLIEKGIKEIEKIKEVNESGK